MLASTAPETLTGEWIQLGGDDTEDAASDRWGTFVIRRGEHPAVF
jgi:hypothetical protein